MSRINSFRIINLNYNNNTMKIDDEIFDLGGQSTLMSLRNGGGKSVMVQMMIAPFVNKRYRNMKDREFNSYFTTNSPTYILTEWILDDEKTNVLIGMMIKRKSISNDEDDEEEIDIINFIHEYEGESKYSIRNIPIVEPTDKGKNIKSFLNSKNLFEKLKKDNEINFNYYNMNISTQSKNYFENIKQYKINHKEWESIIKEINKKESGLSELFNDSKTVTGLVEKWFIKAVEDKLNENKNKIKNFQEMIKKYIYQYKENKYKLNQKDAIEKFEFMTKEILDKANEFKDSKEHTKEIENKIANLIKYLQELMLKENENIENIDSQIEDINYYIKELEYEKLSLEIYKSEDRYNEVLLEEKKIQVKIKELENELALEKRERNILDCAYKYENYQRASKEVLRISNEIEVLKEQDKELAPERENLGYTLNKYYSDKEIKIDEEIKVNLEEINKNNNILKDLENNKIECQKNKEIKATNKGNIVGKLEGYDELEKNFNKQYNKNYQRNIVGYYEENFLEETKENYLKTLKELKKEEENYKLENIQVEENIDQSLRKEKELNIKIYSFKNEKSNLEERLNNINKNIEKRKDILKYIDSDEIYLFDDKYIVEKLNKKIDFIDEENKHLNLEQKSIINQIEKLISGKTIEISKELENKLKQKDIHIVYGMQWLKENNYSENENLEIVKNNPLIPYSIIINKKDIEKLKKETLNIFTSFPIPIIERENLTEIIGKSENEVFILNKSMFLLAFNDKLLNENELKEIINNLESKKLELEEKITSKKLEIDKYNNLVYFINENNLSKNEYDKLNKDIEENKNNINKSEENLKNIESNIKLLKEKLDTIQKEISKKSDSIKCLEREIYDFENIIEKYKQYQNNKEKLSKIEEQIESINLHIEKQDKEIKFISEKIDKLKENKRSLENKLVKIKENVLKYKSYITGEIINKDLEDLEARFDSLTKQLSSNLQQLEKELKEKSENQQREEAVLVAAQKSYELVDKDYINVVYNIEKVNIIDKNIIKLEQTIRENNKVDKNISEKKGNLKKELDTLYNILKDNFEKELPKSKENLTEVEFDKLIFSENNKRKSLEKNKEIYIKNRGIIEKNLGNLSEYSSLEIISLYKIEVDISELKDYIGRTKRDYKNSKDKEYELEIELGRVIDKVSREKEFISNDFFKKSLDILFKVVKNPSEVISNLEQTLAAHKFALEKLSADIEFIQKEKDNVVEILYDYIYEVHINIGKIDRNSTIKIKDKDLKMLNIKTSDWEENKQVYKLKTKNLLESITDICVERLENNENVEEIISKTITTKNLYNEVVSIGSIDVKLYKIEEDRHRIISWEQVCQNSGGEGFLSAFVVLNSLLSFMRKSDTDIFKNYEDSKVIIMDNPFAQTNAEHLLKPLMDIAKKSNTQLIAFSGLKGDSIYNRFENIYVLDLISSKMKSNLRFLRGNHYKGEDSVYEVISSRFEIKEEVVDQITLF